MILTGIAEAVAPAVGVAGGVFEVSLAVGVGLDATPKFWVVTGGVVVPLDIGVGLAIAPEFCTGGSSGRLGIVGLGGALWAKTGAMRMTPKPCIIAPKQKALSNPKMDLDDFIVIVSHSRSG
jgi:hypothetical protein